MNTYIKSLIKKYAEIYAAFEKLQELKKLPVGDQKTGVIAENYAKCYIDKAFKVKAKYASTGKSCDLTYTKDKLEIKIQVKGVSAHSNTRIIAPLNLNLTDGNAPFDYLYLISLDKNFRPDGFYVNSYKEIIKRLTAKKDRRKKIQGAAMKGKNKKGEEIKGYWLFDFTNNLEKDMNLTIKQSY